MPSELQRVAQGLVDVLDEMPRVVAYLQRTAQKLRENAAFIATANNTTARIVAMQMDEAARRCDEAAHYASPAPPRARGWAEQMVSGERNAGPRGGASGPRPDAPSNRSTTEDGRREKRTPESGGSGHEIVAKLPKRIVAPGQRVKTRGVWIDDSSREHELISGQHDPEFDEVQRHAEKLGRVRPGATLSTAADVELKFAMRMRREGITRATIYLNNRPCLKDMSCTTLLPDFLPPGSELTIYAPDDYAQTFRGNREDHE